MSIESIMAGIGKVGDSAIGLIASRRPKKLKKTVGKGLRKLADKLDPKQVYAPRKKKKAVKKTTGKRGPKKKRPGKGGDTK